MFCCINIIFFKNITDTRRYAHTSNAVTTYPCGIPNHLNNERLNVTSVNKTEAFRLNFNVNENGIYHRGITPIFNNYSNTVQNMRQGLLSYGDVDDQTAQGIVFNVAKTYHPDSPLVGKWFVFFKKNFF